MAAGVLASCRCGWADAVNILTVQFQLMHGKALPNAAGKWQRLSGPQDAVTAMVAEFRKRRDAIVKGLNEIPGFRCQLPDGAFLRISQCGRENRNSLKRTRRYSCSMRPEWHGLNGAGFGKYGERLYSIQLRQLAGEYSRGGGSLYGRFPPAGQGG